MITLDQLKDYLDITYELDEGEASKLDGILNRAEGILQSIAGTDELDGTGDEQQLLLDCCRYIRSNAYEDFKTNFANELLMLRAKYAVRNTEGDEENGG